jgi:hypothetical protein
MAARTEKPSKLSQYWETFLDQQTGEPYYYCEDTRATQRSLPSGSAASPVLVLPVGWQAHFNAAEREVYFFHEGRNETVWECPPGYIVLPEPVDIVQDLAVYWETILDGEGTPYYFNERSNETRRDKPWEAVPSKTPGVSRGKLPVMLPQGWYAAADPTGVVYFVQEDPQQTDWDLPRGSTTIASAATGLTVRVLGASSGGGSSSSSTGGGGARAAGSAATSKRGRAEALLARAKASYGGWRAGLALPPGAPWCPRIPHRPRLFYDKGEDSFFVLNPQASLDLLRDHLRGNHTLLCALRGSDAKAYGFAEANSRIPAAAKQLVPVRGVHSTKDIVSGKVYYFDPKDPEKPMWDLPLGTRVLLRHLDPKEDLYKRAKLMLNAKSELKRLRQEKAAGGRVGGGGAAATSATAASAAASAAATAATAAKAVTAAAAAAGGEGKGALEELSSEPPPKPMQGNVEISSADGSSFKPYWLVLDPPSRLLVAFKDESMAVGSECGVMDMLAAEVYSAPPLGAVTMAHAHMLWVHFNVGDEHPKLHGGLFGPLPDGRPSGPSALQFTSKQDLEAWRVELERSRSAHSMESSAPKPPTGLHHWMENASFLSTLRRPQERRVELNTVEYTLSVYEDARSLNLAKVVVLRPPSDSVPVRILFSVDPKGRPQGWSNLIFEVQAPCSGSGSGDSDTINHNFFRCRSYKEFRSCVNPRSYNPAHAPLH